MRNALRSLAAGLAVAVLLPAASADLIRLRNGGEVRGKLRPGHTRDAEVTIDTLIGGVMVVDRKEVAFTTVRSLETEEYEVRAKQIPHTVAGHWELAEWCRQNRLRNQRIEQLELLLLIDPDHAEARRALGYVQDRGEWLTREELMTRRGYTLYQGRWVTQQELDLLEKSDAERAAEREWFTKVLAWVRWAAGSNERQRQQGIAALQQIRDPAAVAALTAHMAEHESIAVRMLFVQVLGNIPGPRSARPLAERSLFDPHALVRKAALDALRPDQYPAASPVYLAALLNQDNAVVNRSAAALARLGDARVIPALFDALVTTHRYDVQIPVHQATLLGLPSGGGTLVDAQALSQYLPPDVEAALRTGQYPFGVIVLPPAGLPQKFRVVRVQAQIPNAEVRAALVKLTGRDFGYEERTWKLWWAAEGQVLLSAV
jgi:hypothetical protein